jgi:cytochrome oxidase assembly protein ShyY1
LLGLVVTTGLSAAPASAATCSDSDTTSIRALLVPVTRLSAHQGRNSDENQTVLTEIKRITQASKSTKLRKSLEALENVIREGEHNPGSTKFWGYREGSAWKTYKQALVLTQKSRC